MFLYTCFTFGPYINIVDWFVWTKRNKNKRSAPPVSSKNIKPQPKSATVKLSSSRRPRQTPQKNLCRLQNLRTLPLRRSPNQRRTHQSLQQKTHLQGHRLPHLHLHQLNLCLQCPPPRRLNFHPRRRSRQDRTRCPHRWISRLRCSYPCRSVGLKVPGCGKKSISYLGGPEGSTSSFEAN